MEINLKEDSQKIYQYLVEKISTYKSPEIGDANDPIIHATFGFQFDQAGWVALVLDSRPDAGPDGEWTCAFEDSVMDFTSWFDAVDEQYENDSPLTLTLTTGETKVIEADDEDEDLAEIIGDMLRDLLLRAKNDGLFSKIPTTNKSTFGVEEICGAYGWPVYEDRFAEGGMS